MGAAFRGSWSSGVTRHVVAGTWGGAFMMGRRGVVSSSSGTGGGAFFGVVGAELYAKSGGATPTVDAGVCVPDGIVDPPPTPPPTIGAKLCTSSVDPAASATPCWTRLAAVVMSLRSATWSAVSRPTTGTIPVRRTAAIAAVNCRAIVVTS